MKINASFFLSLIAIATISCSDKKDDAPEPELPASADYLTGKAVGGGNSSTVVVREDSTIKAFGYWALTDLSNVTSVTNVSVGHRHLLLLKADGTVWACGLNLKGELGTGSNSPEYSPVQVPGLTGVAAVYAGYLTSLALKQDGTVWAWGFNDKGQLGDSTYTDRSSPVKINALGGVLAIDGTSDHSLALKADGSVWAWGSNSSGQIGLPSDTSKCYPLQVSGLSGITSIAAGSGISLAVKNDGTAWAFGTNQGGQLGTGGPEAYSSFPVQITALSGITAVSAFNHCLALKSDSTVWAWGPNNYGQLGDGTNITQNTPVQISGLSNAKKILVSETYHSIAITNDGKIWTWGWNNYGQLSDPSSVSFRNTPSAIIK